jgi:hypothetical protein
MVTIISFENTIIATNAQHEYLQQQGLTEEQSATDL